MDSQLKRTSQILEDMLRFCILDFGRNWSNYLTLIEFSYNNNYQANIQMVPFKALYRRQCRSPIGWFEVGEAKLLGLNLVQDSTENDY